MDKIYRSKGDMKIERRILNKLDEIVKWINEQEKQKANARKVLDDKQAD